MKTIFVTPDNSSLSDVRKKLNDLRERTSDRKQMYNATKSEDDIIENLNGKELASYVYEVIGRKEWI